MRWRARKYLNLDVYNTGGCAGEQGSTKTLTSTTLNSFGLPQVESRIHELEKYVRKQTLNYSLASK